MPATLHGSALSTADVDVFIGRMVPGAPAADAPLQAPDGRATWLLSELGDDFTLLLMAGPGNAEQAARLQAAAADVAPLKLLTLAAPDADQPGALVDVQGLLAQRYDLQPGNAVLLRPDQHVCARWRAPDADALRQALRRALALA